MNLKENDLCPTWDLGSRLVRIGVNYDNHEEQEGAAEGDGAGCTATAVDTTRLKLGVQVQREWCGC